MPLIVAGPASTLVGPKDPGVRAFADPRASSDAGRLGLGTQAGRVRGLELERPGGEPGHRQETLPRGYKRLSIVPRC